MPGTLWCIHRLFDWVDAAPAIRNCMDGMQCRVPVGDNEMHSRMHLTTVTQLTHGKSASG